MNRDEDVSGVICGIYQAANNDSPSDAILQLKLNSQYIAELAKGKCRWGQCEYILHALFWVLRNQTFEDIQKKIPKNWDTVKELLADAVVVAQKLTVPDVKKAEEEIEKNKDANKDVKRNNVASNNKRKNAGARCAAECAKFAAEHWQEVTKELKKWCDFLATTNEMSAAEAVQASQVVAEHVGETPRLAQKYPGNSKPMTKRFDVPLGLVPLESGDKRKGRRSEIYIDANGKQWWSTYHLEQKLKDLLKGKRFAAVKSDYLKEHKEERTLINNWFVSKGPSLYFDPDQLNRLKKKFFGVDDTAVVAKVGPIVNNTEGKTNPDGGSLLKLDELAKALNLPDATAVSTAKFKLLAYHKKNKNAEEYREFEDRVESWFIKSGRVKFFKSGHLSEFRALLAEMPHRKGRDIKEKTEKDAGGDSVSVSNNMSVATVEPTVVQPTEKNMPPAKPVGDGRDGIVTPGGDTQGDEIRKLFAGLGGIRLTQIAVEIMEILLGQMAKSGQPLGTGDREELNKDFADVKSALVDKAKAEQAVANKVQELMDAEQRLATVLGNYLSKHS